MKKILVVNRMESEGGNFIQLTHNNLEEGRVYRVEVTIDSLTWNEWYTSLDSELNGRLARDKFDDLKEKFFTRKVMA